MYCFFIRRSSRVSRRLEDLDESLEVAEESDIEYDGAFSMLSWKKRFFIEDGRFFEDSGKDVEFVKSFSSGIGSFRSECGGFRMLIRGFSILSFSSCRSLFDSSCFESFMSFRALWVSFWM